MVSLLPQPLQRCEEHLSSVCSICQKCGKEEIYQTRMNIGCCRAAVCSLECEKTLYGWAGVVQGFAICSVLLTLLNCFQQTKPPRDTCCQHPVNLSRLQPWNKQSQGNVTETSQNSSNDEAYCHTETSQNSSNDEAYCQMKDTENPAVAHVADSCAEYGSPEQDGTFRDMESSTLNLPQSKSEMHARVRNDSSPISGKLRSNSKIKWQVKHISAARNQKMKTVPHGSACCSGRKMNDKDTERKRCSKPPLKRPVTDRNTTENAGRDDRPQCTVCGRRFQTKWHVNYHMRRKHSGENELECDVCGKLVQGAFDGSEHKRKAHQINYLCDICGGRFFSSSALAGHLATHRGIKTYFCEECGMGFVRKTSLANHQALHNKAARFLCHICSQSFKTRTRLYDHMMNLHHCGPYFENRVRRLKVLGIHVDREAITRLASGLCAVCSQKTTNGRCSYHPHSAQQTFQCTLCGKSENDFAGLYSHSKQHSGNTKDAPTMPNISEPSHGLLSYECKTCFKKFKNKNYLTKHMQQHQEKRFSCEECGKNFTYKCNLKSHLTTHSYSRPFECDVCHKAFKLKYTLDVHQKHHCRQVDALKCQICGKGMIRKQSLAKHYKSVHPESSLPSDQVDGLN